MGKKEMMTVILGGGITGRLAKQLFPDAVVLEAHAEKRANQLTRMWGTNYLWEPIPGNECFQFPVLTHVDGLTPRKESIQKYKDKVGKKGEDDWGLQFNQYSQGFDFLQVPRVQIQYSVKVTGLDLNLKIVKTKQGDFPFDRVISTIPLPYLAQMLGLSVPDKEGGMTGFDCAPIYINVSTGKDPNVTWYGKRLSPKAMYVNYLSDPEEKLYRECWRGGLWHRESLEPPGIRIWPGKIYPSPLSAPLLEDLRRRGVYCFGRFASWSSNELIHETWKKLWWFSNGRIV